jgi:hypothetical protein
MRRKLSKGEQCIQWCGGRVALKRLSQELGATEEC